MHWQKFPFIPKNGTKDGASQAKPLLEKLAQTASTKSEKERAEFYLAGCEYQLGDVENAFWMLGRLSQSAASENLREAALLRLAMLQIEQGLDTEALNSYQTFGRQFPSSEHTPMAIMVQANYWLLLKGNKRRSLPLYDSLIEKFPDSEEAKLASSTLPGLRKMPTSKIRKASRKYVKAMKAARREQKP